MTLPTPASRQPIHTRAVTYRGFRRDDGLWDVEAELLDTKSHDMLFPERGSVAPGAPIHRMVLRVTIDESMTIREIVSDMETTPWKHCHEGQLQQMVGVKLGGGLRQAIAATLSGTQGCTHLRELLPGLATAAFQTVSGWQTQQRRLAGLPFPSTDQPPPFVGQCVAWDVNGPAVAREFPQFVGWVKRVAPAKG